MIKINFKKMKIAGIAEVALFVVGILGFTAELVLGLITNDVFIKILLLVISPIFLVVTLFLGFLVEKCNIYYICPNCKKIFRLSLKKAIFSLHVGYSRFVDCPSCNELCWVKKIRPEDIEQK